MKFVFYPTIKKLLSSKVLSLCRTCQKEAKPSIVYSFSLPQCLNSYDHRWYYSSHQLKYKTPYLLYKILLFSKVLFSTYSIFSHRSFFLISIQKSMFFSILFVSDYCVQINIFHTLKNIPFHIGIALL